MPWIWPKVCPWALLVIKGVGTLINGLMVCIMTRCFSFSVWWYFQVPAVSFQGGYEDISLASRWLPGQCRKDGQIDAMPRGSAWDDDQIYPDHLYADTNVQKIYSTKAYHYVVCHVVLFCIYCILFNIIFIFLYDIWYMIYHISLDSMLSRTSMFQSHPDIFVKAHPFKSYTKTPPNTRTYCWWKISCIIQDKMPPNVGFFLILNTFWCIPSG